MRMQRVASGLFLIVLAGAAMAAQAQAGRKESVALVADMQGRVSARPAANGASAALQLGSEVFVGQTLAVGKEKDARLLLVWHSSGVQYQIPAGATVRIQRDKPLRLSGPAPARLPDGSGRPAYDPKDARRPGAGTMSFTSRAGGLNVVKALLASPLGATFDVRPSFAWVCVPAPEKALISVFRENEALPLWTKEVGGAEDILDYPEDKPALQAGKTYRWLVSVPESADQPGSETATLLWIAPPEVKTRLEALRAAVAARPEDAAARIVLIRSLWSLRFYDQAEEEAAAWAKANPARRNLAALAARLKNATQDIANGSIQRIKDGWPAR